MWDAVWDRRKMTRKAITCEVDSIAKRARLEPRANPYWIGLAGGRGGVSLGYRRAARGPGSWVAKVVIDKKRIEERLGAADDAGAPPDALDFRDAVTAALAWSGTRESEIVRNESGPGVTVRDCVETYISERKARSDRGLDAEQRLGKHVLADGKLADVPLARLTAAALRGWRKRLGPMAPATQNRLCNDLRAALNAAVDADSRRYPAHLPGEIRTGLKAIAAAETARKQILATPDVVALVDAAFEADEDFGRLVAVLAATGARFGQVAEITVGDVQPKQGRIMVPPAEKGRPGQVKPKIAVPVGPDLLDRLAPVLAGRKGHEPLLTRWLLKQTGAHVWEKVKRQSWRTSSEMARPWAKIVEKLELPEGTIPYSLRHSSIVRGLNAGLPVRLVAALHDTSVAMIEKHYSAYIVDMSEELVRRAIVPISSAAVTQLRVVS